MAQRALQFTGLIVGLVALVIQFSISVPAFIVNGHSVAGALVKFFSYFTILTNIAAVLAYAAALPHAPVPGSKWLTTPRVRAGVAVSITVVFIVYAAVLAPLWKPEGLFLLCDVLLHYATPAIFVVWWALFLTDGTLRWSDIPRWLVYPAIYLGWILLRARIAGEAPYPFLDLATNGAASVATSIFFMLCLFLIVGFAAVALDRFAGQPRMQGLL